VKGHWKVTKYCDNKETRGKKRLEAARKKGL
jgi:hypothetical protein